MDAPLETLLKINNVDNNLPIEKSFLDLRLFFVSVGFETGGGLEENLQRGAKSKGGTYSKYLKGGTCRKRGGLS